MATDKKKAAAKKRKGEPQAELYVVFGGRVKDTEGRDFGTPPQIETVGYYAHYDDALRAWQGVSQQRVDDALAKYVIVRLW